MPTRDRTPRLQQLSHVLPIFIVLVSGIVGGSMGLLIGEQSDLVLNIDSSIVGVILGAVFGSALPRLQEQMKAVRVVAALFGVLVPMLGFVGMQRVAPEVLFGMTAAAAISSGFLVTLFSKFSKKHT